MVSSSSCLVQAVQRHLLELDILPRDVSTTNLYMFDSLSENEENKLKKNSDLVEDIDLPCPSASFLNYGQKQKKLLSLCWLFHLCKWKHKRGLRFVIWEYDSWYGFVRMLLFI